MVPRERVQQRTAEKIGDVPQFRKEPEERLETVTWVPRERVQHRTAEKKEVAPHPAEETVEALRRLLIFHDWKGPLTPFSCRQTCVLLEEDNESLPSSSLSLAPPLVFTKQQKTDRKRVFGSEIMEPAELNKALCRNSGSLAGAKQRTRSKTTLVAHSTSDLGTRAFFRGPDRRFPCQERTNLLFEAHRELDCWFGLAANAPLRPNSHQASRIEMSHWRHCVEKGRGTEDIRSGLPPLEA